jgi:hypothetical protein
LRAGSAALAIKRGDNIMKLTAEQINILERYSQFDESITRAEWEIVFTMLDNKGHASLDVIKSLCDLALAGLAVQPRPIADAPRDGEIYGYSLEEQGYGLMEWIEGDGYAQWTWKDELLADSDPEPLPTHFILASSLPKPQE